MTKLIVSDIDGTLVPTGGRSPSPELVEILTKYLDAGTTVALASGRPLSGLINMFHMLRDRLVYICCNGAHIVQNNKTISCSPLASGSELGALVQILRELRYAYMVDTTKDTLMECGIPDEVYRTIIESGIDAKIVPNILETSLPVLKITVACPGNPLELINHPQIMKLHSQYTVVVTAEHYFDITSKNVDKGVAVSEIQHQLGIRPTETIAFGDGMNDIPMFLTTPNSYAVKSAPDMVKARAAHIIPNPEDDGVAKCLCSWFCQDRQI